MKQRFQNILLWLFGLSFLQTAQQELEASKEREALLTIALNQATERVNESVRIDNTLRELLEKKKAELTHEIATLIQERNRRKDVETELERWSTLRPAVESPVIWMEEDAAKLLSFFGTPAGQKLLKKARAMQVLYAIKACDGDANKPEFVSGITFTLNWLEKLAISGETPVRDEAEEQTEEVPA